jgi:hypothetical protein
MRIADAPHHHRLHEVPSSAFAHYAVRRHMSEVKLVHSAAENVTDQTQTDNQLRQISYTAEQQRYC